MHFYTISLTLHVRTHKGLYHWIMERSVNKPTKSLPLHFLINKCTVHFFYFRYLLDIIGFSGAAIAVRYSAQSFGRVHI